MTENTDFAPAEVNRAQWLALAVGVVGLALCALGYFVSPVQFFRAYLVGYLFCLGISVGGMVLLMIYHLTGGAWGLTIRRLLECGMRLLPLVAVLFIPLAFGLKHIYSWRIAGNVVGDRVLEHKAWYLSEPFFLGRTIAYFVLWMILAYFLETWSRQQDRPDNPGQGRRFRLLSGPGLVVYGLTITFAATDWVMSLQPHWYSTMFAALFATSQVLTALAFTIVVLCCLANRSPLDRVVSPDTLNDLGNLLLTFVMLWAYMAFSQFLLVWTGNIREEVPWYLPRTRDGWQYVAVALIVLHFALPFLFLLSKQIKRSRHSLGLVAGGVLSMRLVDLCWQVLPTYFTPTWRRLLPDYPVDQLTSHWLDLVVPVGLGGLFLAAYLWQLKTRPLIPAHDPSLNEAIRLHNLELREVPQHG
jgi:hypothetical protein